MPTSKREMVARVLGATGIGRLLRTAKLWDGLLVVNYHRVGDGAKSRFDQDLFSATAEEFDAQLRFFKESFDIVEPEDLPQIQRARGRYLQITFDDGYRDNYEIVFPILRAHRTSATFFVASGYIDQPRIPWWDELSWMVRGYEGRALAIPAFFPAPMRLCDAATRSEAIRRLNAFYTTTPLDEREAVLDRVGEAAGTGRATPALAATLWMTWDMIREMHRGGMRFGGHTVNHVELSRLPPETQDEEIRVSKRRVEEELGVETTVFSYPFGRRTSFNQATRASLAAAGVRFAYTYYGGYQKPGHWDEYNLRRIAVETELSFDLLAAMGTLPQVFSAPEDSPLLRMKRMKRALRP